MINAAVRGRSYRYGYAAPAKPGWFLFDGLVKHDLLTGGPRRHSPSATAATAEPPWRPDCASPARTKATGHDDHRQTPDASYWLIFNAAPGSRRPRLKLQLPERVPAAPTRPGRRDRRWPHVEYRGLGRRTRSGCNPYRYN